MEILLNGKRVRSEAETLSALIQEQEINTRGVAVAVGSRIVRRSDWDKTALTEGLSITIICATQGG